MLTNQLQSGVKVKPIVSVTLKKRNDPMRQTKINITLVFSTNQNDLPVKQAPIPVLFLIGRVITHHS